MTLLRSSLPWSARKSYKHSWNLIFIFDKSITRLPLSVIQICNFIGALFDKSYSPSTITSDVSAISYIHKILGIFDPTSAFVVKKLLKGCNNLRKSNDTRLPITKQILEKIIDGIDKCIDNNFTKTLLKAVFLLAFNACLRLGEILVRSPKEAGSVIQKQDVTFTYCNRRPQSLTLVIRHYKNNQPVTITIEANHNNSQLCPVTAVHSHLENQSRVDGPVSKHWGNSSYTELRNMTINFYLEIFRHRSKILQRSQFSYRGCYPCDYLRFFGTIYKTIRKMELKCSSEIYPHFLV
jgi:hypothetical protein